MLNCYSKYEKKRNSRPRSASYKKYFTFAKTLYSRLDFGIF